MSRFTSPMNKLDAKSLGQHWRIFERVRQAFDAAALERICGLDEQEFAEYGKRFVLPKRPERYFYYNNIHSPILAVAHLDSVQKDRRCDVFAFKNGGQIVFSPVLDDRLGAYVILDLLPKLKIKTDVLLTIGEETGKSTAEHFQTKRQYNWMFSFDRREDDVVTYRYRNDKLDKMLESVGADPGYGSFSDICELEHLGCQGMNWGVGYEDYHSERAFAYLNTTFHQVARFIRFYYQFSNQHLKHEAKHRHYVDVEHDWSGSYAGGYGGYMAHSGKHDGTMRSGNYEDADDQLKCKTCQHTQRMHTTYGTYNYPRKPGDDPTRCCQTIWGEKTISDGKGGKYSYSSGERCACTCFAKPEPVKDIEDQVVAGI